MKKIITLSIFLLLGKTLLSQDQEDLVLFSKGNALYEMVYDELDIDYELKYLDTTKLEEKITYEMLQEHKELILEKALAYFEELIQEFPTSDLRYRAMNNAALVSYELGHNKKAIEYYQNILKSEAKDQEKGGVGQGIMANPYALYKNRACKNLGEIYIQEAKYQEAIKYLDLTAKYPYQHFCGNGHAENEIYMASLYTKSYRGLGEIKKALNYSLPFIFNNDLASNKDIVELSVEILKENFSMEEIGAAFEKACESYYAEERKNKNKESKEYFITFLERKIPLPFYELYYIDDIDLTIKEQIEKSYFRKLIKNK